MKRKGKKNKEFGKLILVSIIIALLCAVLGDLLKFLTEYYESRFFDVTERNWLWILIFPFLGLSLIHVLRHTFFKKRENKGIKEISDSLKTRHNELLMYKIPSHFINGLITVVFGGSTGIEVSTVVSSASIGVQTKNRMNIHPHFKKELICVGVAAGVTVLFSSPIAGLLFALEVIFNKLSRNLIISVLVAVLTVWLYTLMLNSEPLFHVRINYWNHYAFPYFLLLGVLAGLNSVYLTKCVLFFKSSFSKIHGRIKRIFLGSMIISACLLIFPELYGDGYHAMREIFTYNQHLLFHYSFVFGIVGILILKPIVASATLASGGDGGVFAPSLFIGAFLGLLVAFLLNHFFKVDVIPVNFMLIGMGAVLSASLHAPFTSVFLICGIVGDYTLIVPVLAACLVSKLTAKMIIPYTVYSYSK